MLGSLNPNIPSTIWTIFSELERYHKVFRDHLIHLLIYRDKIVALFSMQCFQNPRINISCMCWLGNRFSQLFLSVTPQQTRRWPSCHCLHPQNMAWSFEPIICHTHFIPNDHEIFPMHGHTFPGEPSTWIKQMGNTQPATLHHILLPKETHPPKLLVCHNGMISILHPHFRSHAIISWCEIFLAWAMLTPTNSPGHSFGY